MYKAIIEMPATTKFKYEQDKTTGLLKLDRALEIPIPFNYGYLKDTLAEDNDALDVFVVSIDPIFPLTILDVEIVGVLKCVDNGIIDDKIIAHIKDDWTTKVAWGNLNAEEKIQYYLRNYKQGFVIKEYCDIIEAQKIIKECEERFK